MGSPCIVYVFLSGHSLCATRQRQIAHWGDSEVSVYLDSLFMMSVSLSAFGPREVLALLVASGMPCSFVLSTQAFSQIFQVASCRTPVLQEFISRLSFNSSLRRAKSRYFVPILRKFSSGSLHIQYCQSGRQTRGLGWGSELQIYRHQNDRCCCCRPWIRLPSHQS